MNQSHDIASELSETARRVPFPPEQRRIVLALPGGRTDDPEDSYNQMQLDWIKRDNDTVFNPPCNSGWGIVLIHRGMKLLPMAYDCVLEQFRKGVDVFQYCPTRRNFLRLDRDEFILFY